MKESSEEFKYKSLEMLFDELLEEYLNKFQAKSWMISGEISWTSEKRAWTWKTNIKKNSEESLYLCCRKLWSYYSWIHWKNLWRNICRFFFNESLKKFQDTFLCDFSMESLNQFLHKSLVNFLPVRISDVRGNYSEN